MIKKLGLVAAAAALMVMTGSCQNKDGPTDVPGFAAIDGEYLKTGGDGSNWAMTGFSYNEQRHSPLTQINADNVKDLGIAWFADLPDARGQEATPVVVDGKMFVSTAWSKVLAFDAKTGKPLWSFDPEVDKARGVKACCDVVNRGVAFWKGSVFVGTIDGRLISLDASTGKQLWSAQTLDPKSNGTITGVPRVVKDKVVIGFGGAEFGARGYVTAYDADTGKQVWRFYTTPNPKGEPDGAASDEILKTSAIKTWSAKPKKGDWRESGGGGTVWDAIVYDAELDQLYLGVGNGNPWNHGVRSNGEGDNLFLSSIVALKPDTGEYVWHYQETPAESWDYTATQPIILATEKRDGKDVKVLYHAPKNGFFFTIDRVSGKMLSADPFIDGITWAKGYDLKTGRPIENPEARYEKTGKLYLANPSPLGAHNWHPMSYNPATGLVYIPALYIGGAYMPPAAPNEQERKPLGFNTGGAMATADLPDDVNFVKAVKAAITGKLVAFDPRTGKAKWTVDHPASWNGGTMTTAGNLVFQGTAMGEFRAYAADSGKQLLNLNVQSGVLSGASTYMVDGEQYVAFLTSKGGAFPLVIGYAGATSSAIPNIPRLIVLKLGGKVALPALPETPPYVWDPPAKFGTAADIAAGQSNFQRYCLVCHGPGAVGNGVLPDLRKSAAIADAGTWKSVVIDGVLKGNGMVSFAAVLTPKEADQVRAYVVTRAHYGKEHDAALVGGGKPAR
ncbi:PQQ-dependent dehydrogenase, methanol/ethanol family [Sphingorhabdus contaminans]|uniref:PQQ-dependent dehydrogenase, methanol/ethanol family n=1 Tax=Sphingorhabdus contaminans TaxID=1343899 RepID=A0A553W9B4_9SPHN|nr:PQQ-dependent dehydrogenase, methanol/ethanol family [Sphingorhabdus contaminans]TSB01285.1 PQQ-dependent dehydrogenase, methanol/ethanol family [Sphingorhabdus contaminans]